jgi:hypothetical protein
VTCTADWSYDFEFVEHAHFFGRGGLCTIFVFGSIIEAHKLQIDSSTNDDRREDHVPQAELELIRLVATTPWATLTNF